MTDKIFASFNFRCTVVEKKRFLVKMASFQVPFRKCFKAVQKDKMLKKNVQFPNSSLDFLLQNSFFLTGKTDFLDGYCLGKHYSYNSTIIFCLLGVCLESFF